MKLENPKITILVNSEYTTIELYDDLSNITFAKIRLSPSELSSALSRTAHTTCDLELRGLDKIGKKMIHRKHEFEIPDNIPYDARTKVLSEIIKETLPDGWVSDNSFSSQNTFFEKDGKKYAQTTIRTWI